MLSLTVTFLCMFEIRVFLWQGLNVEEVNVPVIGGHSGVTILPLLSQVGCLGIEVVAFVCSIVMQD